MSGHHKWADIKHKSSPEQMERARRELDKEYNRLRWRLVRLYDRVTRRNR